MTKKLIWGPILGDLVQIWAPENFLQVLPLLVVRHCSKLSSYAIERKANELNLRKWQKVTFGHNFGLFDPNLGPRFFLFCFVLFLQVLPLLELLGIVSNDHPMQFKGKLMSQTWENGKKLLLDCLTQIWAPTFFLFCLFCCCRFNLY